MHRGAQFPGARSTTSQEVLMPTMGTAAPVKWTWLGQAEYWVHHTVALELDHQVMQGSWKE